MDRIVEIGIYEYINEAFPYLSKDNKVLYFSIFMKRPQFFYSHLEWLYNNPNAFIGFHMIQLKQYPDSYSHKDSEVVKLNDELDETYLKYKYSTEPTICRNRSENCTVEECIQTIGLYSYIDCYGGMTTGRKLILYCEMMHDDKLFHAHCMALRQNDDKFFHAHCMTLRQSKITINYIFAPVQDIGSLFI